MLQAQSPPPRAAAFAESHESGKVTHELAAKLPSNGCLIGDMGYDAKKLRVDLAFRGNGDCYPDRTAILSTGHGVSDQRFPPYRNSL